MPGLKGALSVRVNDGVTDRIVSRYCRGLKFTKVAPGGHRDLSFTMVLPRNLFPGLGPDDRAYVYDVRTGRPIFDAYLENPTPTDGPGGQQYDVQAMGGMALANDETRPLIYVDTATSQWTKEPSQLRPPSSPRPTSARPTEGPVPSGRPSQQRRRLGGQHGAPARRDAHRRHPRRPDHRQDRRQLHLGVQDISGATFASTLVPRPRGTADWFVVDTKFLDTDYFVLLCRRIGPARHQRRRRPDLGRRDSIS
jgi:hypothetical protein